MKHRFHKILVRLVLLIATISAVTLIFAFNWKSTLATKPCEDLCLHADSLPERMSISPSGEKAYITDIAKNAVHVLPLHSNSTARLIELPGPSIEAAFSPDGTKAYVTTSGDGGMLAIVDAIKDEVLRTIQLGTRMPSSVAVSSDGRRVYITAADSPRVIIVDPKAGNVVASIYLSTSVTAHSNRIAIVPDGTRAYVTLSSDTGDSVVVVDTVTNSIVRNIAFDAGTFCEGITVTSDGMKVYVALLGHPGSVRVIDTQTNTILATIKVGSLPRDIVSTRSGDKVFVSNTFGNPRTVSVIDVKKDVIVATIPVDDIPGVMAISPDGGSLYILSMGAKTTLIVIDTRTNTILAKSNSHL